MGGMNGESLMRRILDPDSRADPYPLYAELRRTPVCRQEDGSYAVSTYHEVLALLHDPRLTSVNAEQEAADGGRLPPSILGMDPPEHDRVRSLLMRQFGPPHTPNLINDMRGDLEATVDGLIDAFPEEGKADLVDAFAYPFPVTVICRLLGVPPEDEPRFRGWADKLVASIDPRPGEDPAVRLRQGAETRQELALYLNDLVEKGAGRSGDGMLFRLAGDRDAEGGPLSRLELLVASVLLLIAGHETTVNLITNGALTLLRRPEQWERLRREPEIAPRLVEELLRFEPPVQMIPRRGALADIEVGDVTIPAGSTVALVLASGNRDPKRFTDPEAFDPDRPDIEHLGFGSGIHICFGAPLARLEAQVALTRLVRRLDGARLLQDPPPYRSSAVLRGPRHLAVGFDRVLG
ncbi:cytochrome P450 [Streptomyces pacificus]|uniref:Cytochrome P450 n=2 Tax=Streptomyces pacificus TaxID=2705029 RepID=A0A6A0B3M7_9ACTN|nr:cytochrome P450 [Streptomyces pacificus]